MKTYDFRAAKLLVYISFFLLTCCNPNSIYTYPPNQYSERYSPLDSESIGKIKEISSWKIIDDPLALLKYNNLSNNLISVTEENKEIVKLDIETGETESHKILNVSSLRIFSFDAKGEKLLGAMSSTGINSRGESAEYLEWFAIWDTSTGLQVECIWGSCSEGDDSIYEASDIGSSADLDSEIIVSFSETAYSIQTNNSSGFTLVNSPDADYWYHIGNVAIDSHNKRLAIVYQEGRIELRNITCTGFCIISALKKGDENQLQPIHVALFDRTGKWLAIVRGDQLSIWDVDGWIKKIVYREEVDAIHGMSFSPSSKFLFLATEDKIKIINLDENKLEAELSTPNITSLDISEDNRLMFWGDENGIVHLWGVPQSQ